MEHGYAALAANAASQSIRPDTTLTQIEYMATRADQTADAIERFIARFRGLPCGPENGRPIAVPSGHEGQISRLNEQLSRIESLASTLSEIG